MLLQAWWGTVEEVKGAVNISTLLHRSDTRMHAKHSQTRAEHIADTHVDATDRSARVAAENSIPPSANMRGRYLANPGVGTGKRQTHDDFRHQQRTRNSDDAMRDDRNHQKGIWMLSRR